MSEISRRSVLTSALGSAGAGIAAAVWGSSSPATALDAPYATSLTPASATSTSAPGTTIDLNLHIWDRVVRAISDSETATLKVTSGVLPTGLSIAGRYLTGRMTTNERYSFEMEIREGTTKRRQIFAGTIGTIKQDLSISLSIDKVTSLDVTAKELDRIALIGANAILVIFCYIPTPTSSTFTRVSDARINQVLTLARERGVRITMVKPHIVTEELGDSFYRGEYKPSSIDAFLTNWRDQLLYFTQLCKSNGVEYLSITCEQRWQTEAEHYNRWVPLIVDIRQAHPALKLTASFTTLELYLIYTYWLPQGVPHMVVTLDVLGVTSWVRLTNKTYTPSTPNISVDELVAGWRGGGGLQDDHLGKLEWVGDKLQMPFFITEVGVQPRVDGLAKQEGGNAVTGAYDHQVQALLLRSVMQGPMLSRWCTGVSIWHMRAPFHLGNVNGASLYPGENVLKDEIARVPSLAEKRY